MTQPGVSRQVKQLEQALGFALIDRDQRPVAMTPAGSEFLSSAEAILKEIESAIQRMSAGSTPAGSIVVAASSIPGEFLVPGILARFSAIYPRVRPSLITTDSAGVAEALLARRAEIGFLGAKVVEQRLRLIPFSEDEIVLVVPAVHPLADKPSVVLADLASQTFVERSEGSGTLGSLKRILSEHGMHLPEHSVAMIAGTSQVQLAAIEAGVGLGFVSSLALANRSQLRVKGMSLEGMKIRRTLYLAHENAPLSLAAQTLVDFICEQKDEHGSTTIR